MKPHLKLIRSLWYCAVRGGRYGPEFVGLGYTPAHAYADWKAKQ